MLDIVDPFLLIDEVKWDSSKKKAFGRLDITEDMWFYKCHFVDEGVMPGVLQTEVMLQTTVAGICCEYSIRAAECLINSSNVNFFSIIKGSGRIEVISTVRSNELGLIEAKAGLNFKNKKVAVGKFRFVRPSQFKVPVV